MKKNESKLVKYTLIAICLIFVFLFLVLPLYIVFAEAFRDGIEKYREAVTDKYTISAVILTLEATVFCSCCEYCVWCICLLGDYKV